MIKNPTWPTEWMMQTVMMAWNDYLYSGDSKIITNYLDQLYAHTLFSFLNKETGLVSTNLIKRDDNRLAELYLRDDMSDIVDWPQCERDSFEFSDYNAVVNAYHYKTVVILAQIYQSLDRKEESQTMRDYSIRFKNLFNSSFFDAEKRLYRDGLSSSHYSLHANMFALCFGLVPDEYVQSVSDYIVSRGMACSVYGAQFLLDALYNVGRGEDALNLLVSEEERSWVNMMREGTTITMEAWGNNIKPNQDWNHAWGAAPANIIPFRLMGIRPIEPGFTHAEIRPQTAFLREAECTVPTQYGPITVSANNSGIAYSLNVSIPEPIICDVYLPLHGSPSDYLVFIDGKEVTDFTIEGGFVKLPTSLFGSHLVELKRVDTSVTYTKSEHSKTRQIYNVNGYYANKKMFSGIYIIDGHKYIIK